MSDFVIKGDTLLEYTGTDTDVVIPDGIRRIGKAFREKNITSVTMPDSVSILCVQAFYGCDELREVKFSKNLKGIYLGAFEGCVKLKEIALPERLSMIASRAFANCTGLTSVVIPQSVGVIRDEAFFGCSSLRSITLPSQFYFAKDLFLGTDDPFITLQLWDPAERPAERLLIVRYAGSKEEWSLLSERLDTSFLSVVHCSDGDVLPTDDDPKDRS